MEQLKVEGFLLASSLGDFGSGVAVVEIAGWGVQSVVMGVCDGAVYMEEQWLEKMASHFLPKKERLLAITTINSVLA